MSAFEATVRARAAGKPELRTVHAKGKDGNTKELAVCNIRVAVNQGPAESDTLWLNLTMWGDLGKRVANEVNKGDLMIVKGNKMRSALYDTNAGGKGINLQMTVSELYPIRVNPAGKEEQGEPFVFEEEEVDLDERLSAL